jgi:hypothetical protein
MQRFRLISTPVDENNGGQVSPGNIQHKKGKFFVYGPLALLPFAFHNEQFTHPDEAAFAGNQKIASSLFTIDCLAANHFCVEASIATLPGGALLQLFINAIAISSECILKKCLQSVPIMVRHSSG